MTPGPPDEVLFRAVCAGGEEAFRALIERYHASLYGLLLRMVGDRHRAEDLFQDTWVQVWRHRARFRSDHRFRPWLYTIAMNRARDTGRRLRVRARISLPFPEAWQEPPTPPERGGSRDPAQAAADREAAARVKAAVTGLPQKGREAILLYYYQGLDQREVAEILDVPLGTVKSRIHYALAHIARALGIGRDTVPAERMVP